MSADGDRLMRHVMRFVEHIRRYARLGRLYLAVSPSASVKPRSFSRFFPGTSLQRRGIDHLAIGRGAGIGIHDGQKVGVRCDCPAFPCRRTRSPDSSSRRGRSTTWSGRRPVLPSAGGPLPSRLESRGQRGDKEAFFTLVSRRPPFPAIWLPGHRAARGRYAGTTTTDPLSDQPLCVEDPGNQRKFHANSFTFETLLLISAQSQQIVALAEHRLQIGKGCF